MNEKEILEILHKSELINMCKNHFDSDTVKKGIEEIKNELIKINRSTDEDSVLFEEDVIDFLKGMPKDYCAVIQVQPHDSNHIYTIEVFLYDGDKIGIVGDFSQEYEMDELDILQIIK